MTRSQKDKESRNNSRGSRFTRESKTVKGKR